MDNFDSKNKFCNVNDFGSNQDSFLGLDNYLLDPEDCSNSIDNKFNDILNSDQFLNKDLEHKEEPCEFFEMFLMHHILDHYLNNKD